MSAVATKNAHEVIRRVCWAGWKATSRRNDRASLAHAGAAVYTTDGAQIAQAETTSQIDDGAGLPDGSTGQPALTVQARGSS